MTKQEFVDILRSRLDRLPIQDIEDSIGFYIEMIEDRVEEGLSEEEAVSAIGSPYEIAEQIVCKLPLSKIAKEAIKPKRALKTTEIVLLALGSPIWLSLLIAAIAVVVALYASLWSGIASLWAGFAALAVVGPCGVVMGIGFLLFGSVISGLSLLGVGAFSAGCAIFLFFGCVLATKGVVRLTSVTILWIKKSFLKKEAQYEEY